MNNLKIEFCPKEKQVLRKYYNIELDNFQVQRVFIENKIRQFSEKLQINWKLIIIIQDFKDFECQSFPEDKHHEIFISPDTFKNFKSDPIYFLNLAHEFCHLSLAEKIDAVFSTLIWSEEYKLENYGSLLEGEMLGLAWGTVVEFWAEDICYKFWSELSKLDQKVFFEAMKMKAFIFQNMDLLERKSLKFEFILKKIAGSIALDIVLAERFDFQSFDYSHITYSFGDEFVALTNNLIEFYKSNYFRQLSYNKERDLNLIFESVKKAVEIFCFPIRPSLIMEEGFSVWKVE